MSVTWACHWEKDITRQLFTFATSARMSHSNECKCHIMSNIYVCCNIAISWASCEWTSKLNWLVSQIEYRQHCSEHMNSKSKVLLFFMENLKDTCVFKQLLFWPCIAFHLCHYPVGWSQHLLFKNPQRTYIWGAMWSHAWLLKGVV